MSDPLTPPRTTFGSNRNPYVPKQDLLKRFEGAVEDKMSTDENDPMFSSPNGAINPIQPGAPCRNSYYRRLGLSGTQSGAQRGLDFSD